MGMDFSMRETTQFLNLESPECCGWIQVNGFNTHHRECVKSDIKLITSPEFIICENGWSNAFDVATQFPMFCVLIDSQVKVFHEALTKAGFNPVFKFYNPNTFNQCTQYAWDPRGGEKIDPDEFLERDDDDEDDY